MQKLQTRENRCMIGRAGQCGLTLFFSSKSAFFPVNLTEGEFLAVPPVEAYNRQHFGKILKIFS